MSSIDADEPGKPREHLLDDIRDVVRLNMKHPTEHSDGVHLDIEPQQRQENKGAGDLAFLPGLVDAYRAVRAMVEPAQMTVNADIPTKLLKGDLARREILLSALPRLTLMLYGLSKPGDRDESEKLQSASEDFLEMAYHDLND